MQLVPDWFVTHKKVEVWCDKCEYYDDDDDNDKFIEWYDGFNKRKKQKAQIKEELLPIAWHPSGWWDLCVSEN